jgi:putative membrane protein
MFGIFGLLLPLLWVLLVVGLVVWAVRSAKPSSPAALPPADAALQELRLRYARGELTREEFVQRNADLGGGAQPPPPG